MSIVSQRNDKCCPEDLWSVGRMEYIFVHDSKLSGYKPALTMCMHVLFVEN